jgi:predicted Fe-Mo cluster-binding NifX family protein
MIVAVSTNGDNLESAIVDPRFGRCNNFMIINSKDLSYYIVDNQAKYEGHGAGISAAQFIINERVEAVISGNIGPNAYQTLNAANVKMYIYNGQIINAIKELQENSLKQVTQPTRPGSRGFGNRSGMGQGRGRR